VTFQEIVADGALSAAPLLLGWTLLVDGVGGRLVEVEAYEQDDPASHSYRGPTAANETMFGPPGRLYVYRSYGVHWCANVTCAPDGVGAAVLLRALEPVAGLDRMRERRGTSDPSQLGRPPGRLAQALGIDGGSDGARLDEEPFRLLPPDGPVGVVTTTRVGISKAAERPWRFVERGSSWTSGPRRASS
jgi:DNA-3-methyladenine glycosylase